MTTLENTAHLFGRRLVTMTRMTYTVALSGERERTASFSNLDWKFGNTEQWVSTAANKKVVRLYRCGHFPR
jgi:hypothetical protein